MSKLAVAYFLAACLLGCATRAEPENSYDRGVAAYKAKNFEVARARWSEAAGEGNISALNNLGYLLYFALGGAPDPTQAVDLWKRAALAGHSESQWHLGYAYEKGVGVAQSNPEAYAWYRCAVASAESGLSGDKDAEADVAADAHKSLARLLEKLSKEEFASGEQLAKEYVGKYVKARVGT